MAEKDKKEGIEDQDVKRTRITFSGNRLPPMQQVTNQLVANAKAQAVKITGPVRVPNKHLRICCRRTPCGEGSKTWDRFQMRIHKRLIDLHSPSEIVKQITSISIEPGVEVEVTIADV